MIDGIDGYESERTPGAGEGSEGWLGAVSGVAELGTTEWLSDSHLEISV